MMTTAKGLFDADQTIALGVMVTIAASILQKQSLKKQLDHGEEVAVTSQIIPRMTVAQLHRRQSTRTVKVLEMTTGVEENLKKERETATMMTTAKGLFDADQTIALGVMVTIAASILQKQSLRRVWFTLATPHPHI